ncbi:pyruvate kinase [Mannheimia bovis]|uniref:Pyruvate kinase n=1 Tax=Mannheimia bovis TaxID=2770636 RepID=A0A7H1BZW2_9PAST|nr:pyruvate kinase [Mannheimia bovis]QNS14267.1 pyruvate kinase [Mannheimia bovis]
MKPFNLEEALAGEPVKLRSGRKAYIKYSLKAEKVECGVYSEIQGYVLNERNQFLYACSWTEEGNYYDFNSEDDIIGMWEEQQPRITLNLPAPLKEPREGMCFIKWGMIYKSNWVKSTPLKCMEQERLKEGGYFANEQDAQEWIDAMKNNRA